jgi:hypothetical protein
VATCIATPLVTLVIAGFPHVESISMRLVLATAIELGFLGAVSARILRGVVVRRQDERSPRAVREMRPART